MKDHILNGIRQNCNEFVPSNKQDKKTSLALAITTTAGFFWDQQTIQFRLLSLMWD